MSKGYIRVQAFTAAQALPVSGARVTFTETNGDAIAERTTNLNGQTALVEIETPEKNLSQSPQENGTKVFSTINIKVTMPMYQTMIFEEVQVFSDQVSIQNVFLVPLPEYTEPNNQPSTFTVVPQTL